MGMFDYIIIEEGIDLPKFPEDKDHTELEWQTKDIGRPSMRTYKITEDRKLLRKEVEKAKMTPEEQRERAREEGYESWEEWEQNEDTFGPIETWKYKVVDEWWVDHNMHGSFEFHASTSRVEGFEDFYWSYEARYTKGKLQEIVFLGGRGSDNMTPPHME
jgi:hypothetical protein